MKNTDDRKEDLSKFQKQRQAFMKAFLEAHLGKCPVIDDLNWDVRVAE